MVDDAAAMEDAAAIEDAAAAILTEFLGPKEYKEEKEKTEKKEKEADDGQQQMLRLSSSKSDCFSQRSASPEAVVSPSATKITNPDTDIEAIVKASMSVSSGNRRRFSSDVKASVESRDRH